MAIERTSASKSTETAKKVSGIIRRYYAEAHEAASNGEPIAWCMDGGDGAGPCELRLALGVHTFYPEHWATVCSAKQTGLPLLEKAEGEGYANYTCSYARIGLGYAAQMREVGHVPDGSAWGGMARPHMLIGRTSCDPGLNWFQAFSRYGGVPLHVFDRRRLPGDANPDDPGTKRRYLDNYIGQMRSLVAFMEKALGRKMDWDRLSQYIALHYRARRLWYDIHELRKTVPCPMPSEDKFSCMFPNSYMMGTQEAVDFYQELYDEVKERVEHKIGVIPKEEYRLLFVGIPQWHHMAFFNALEACGAVCVIESTYYMEEPPEVDTSNPLEALAERYWEEQAIAVRRAQKESMNDLKVGLVLHLAREFQVDGVVCHLIMSCRPQALGAAFMSDLLRRRLEVPAFFLESDICDPRVASATEVEARIEAFMDTLAAHKTKPLHEDA